MSDRDQMLDVEMSTEDDDSTTIWVSKSTSDLVGDLKPALNASGKNDVIDTLIRYFLLTSSHDDVTTRSAEIAPADTVVRDEYQLYCPVCKSEIAQLRATSTAIYKPVNRFNHGRFICPKCSSETPTASRWTSELVALDPAKTYSDNEAQKVLTNYWDQTLRNPPSEFESADIDRWINTACDADWDWAPPLEPWLDLRERSTVFETAAELFSTDIAKLDARQSDEECCSTSSYHFHCLFLTLDEEMVKNQLNRIHTVLASWTRNVPATIHQQELQSDIVHPEYSFTIDGPLK